MWCSTRSTSEIRVVKAFQAGLDRREPSLSGPSAARLREISRQLKLQVEHEGKGLTVRSPQNGMLVHTMDGARVFTMPQSLFKLQPLRMMCNFLLLKDVRTQDLEEDVSPRNHPSTSLSLQRLNDAVVEHEATPPMEQAEESDLASAQPTLAPRAVYQRRQRNYVSMSGRQPFRRAAPPGSEDESSDSSESSSSEEDEDEFGRLLRRVQMRLPKIDRSAHVAVPLVTVPEQPQPSAAPCAQPQNVAIQHPVTNQLATQARPSGIPRLQTADPPSTTGHSADLQKFLDSGVYKRLLNKVRDQKWRALQKYNRLRQHSVRNKIYMGCDQIRKGDAMEKIKAEHAVVELTRSIQKLEFDKNELHSARANVFEMEDAARRDDPTTYATAMEYVWATDTKTRTSSETQTVD
ncbi:hypothetical protein QR680_003144 [Steinernema hermaphroditum]|uniref:Uncharacterized protein n=1 Tax=Steinernema hermaphroditum TaxID=289476 RepID=A0AA39H5J2_9BILA|nr:hypothetical protein QR680_003144 [Steinernema hermaphroditum]